MKVSKDFLKTSLERLYKEYPKTLMIDELSREVLKKEADNEIRGICFYLADRGLIVQENLGAWRITAQGIDKLKGKSLI